MDDGLGEFTLVWGPWGCLHLAIPAAAFFKQIAERDGELLEFRSMDGSLTVIDPMEVHGFQESTPASRAREHRRRLLAIEAYPDEEDRKPWE